MGSYSNIKANCGSRKRYADGGRISKTKQGGKVVVNVISSPPVAGGMPPAPPQAAPMGNSPSPAGPPVPPQAAQAMLSGISGKPPGMFASGGRVKGGAESGVGRAAQAAKAKRK